MNALTGRPLPGAHVMIFSTTWRTTAQQVVTTADDGRFLFGHLDSGKYSLQAECRGFPRQPYEGHEMYSTAIVVGPDKQSDDLVFRLKPGGSIFGTVTDEHGDTVRGGQVHLLARGLERGEWTTYPRAETTTDDAGTYRFAHLLPGSYFIFVVAQPWYAQVPRGPDGAIYGESSPLDVAYPITYYPGATSADAATAIDLHLGERFQADFTLTAVPALQVRLTNLNMEAGRNEFPLMTTTVFGGVHVVMPAPIDRREGNDELTGIAPGQYDLELRTADRNGASGIERRSHLDLSSSGDVDATQMSASAPVSGTVKLDAVEDAGGDVRVQFADRKHNRGARARISAKGTFDNVFLVPGTYEVIVSSPVMWGVTSLSAVNARVIGHSLEITSPDPIQVSISASRRFGTVSGTVLRDNKSTAGALVLLVPDDIQDNRSLVRLDQSDSDGTFTLGAVVPGKYHVLALQDGWNVAWAEPGALDKYLPKSTPLQVDKSSKYEVQVTLQ